MNDNWKPGDIAMVNGDVCVYLGPSRGWEHGRSDCFAYNETTNAARRLVVIDPEDRDQVERLIDLLWATNDEATASNDMQDALREFANPSIPKPTEPLGLGAVVEDASGDVYVRTSDRKRPWCRSGTNNHLGWDEMDDEPLTVLSQGVTQ